MAFGIGDDDDFYELQGFPSPGAMSPGSTTFVDERGLYYANGGRPHRVRLLADPRPEPVMFNGLEFYVSPDASAADVLAGIGDSLAKWKGGR